MRVVSQFPRAVRQIQTEWITLSDGCRLAARIWLPVNAEADPVPAILEYLPYRRRDGTSVRDAGIHGYFAGHGYACVRVDIRGTGDSDGLLTDEYLPQEQADGVEIIAWIARQPWCTGAVGMVGISWGGFNGLQIAAHRPPALRAVLTLCSTDDRYADDTHYMGGALLCGNLNWSSNFLSTCTKPPDPAVVGERWREMWLERLAHLPQFVETWTRHQHRDAYWRQGSVAEDFAAITCPVYAVGGWADGYTNAIPRLLAGLKAPAKGLIGPWGHAWPHVARPGPQIGFLQEALRWWDQWLKGRDTGIMEEPKLRVWLQDSVPPAADYETWPGRWVAEPDWPPPDAERLSLPLGPGGLGAAGEAALLCASPQATGWTAGVWCPYGMPGDMPADQRPDDARSLCFDGETLAAPLEVLGAPVAVLELSVDRPTAVIAVRLCDVAPDGASTRVSYGLLNLAHRDGHDRPAPLEPGRRITVRVVLNDLGHAFAPGRRLRLAVSTAYWPTMWPSAEPVALTLYTAGSRLELPLRRPRPADSALPAFPAPEGAPEPPHAVTRGGDRTRVIRIDPVTGTTTIIASKDRGGLRLADVDVETDTAGIETYRIRDDDPLTAEAEMRWTARIGREGWRVRTETWTRLTATAAGFLLTGTLDAYEDERRVATRVWEAKIPRDLV